MKTVILAGGPGTRLWPLSNAERSKAFQPVIRGESMLQYTYRQLSKVIEPKDMYLQAPSALTREVLEQLPNITPQNLILNPKPKDTLPIILWVLSEYSEDPDEPVLIRCVDQYIPPEAEAGFLASLTTCIRRYDSTQSAITLLCTEYTRFHPGNGYVVADKSNTITSFIEKPDRKDVEALAKQATLYRNPFMVILSKNALLHALGKLDFPWARASEHFLQASRQKRKQLFLEMELLSISDTVFRHATDLKLAPIDYDFLDVGTYGALYELNDKDTQGNVVIGAVILGSDCHNSFIANQTNTPLVVESTNHQVVVQTSAGTLSISLEHADHIKDIYKKQLLPSLR